MIPQVSVWCWRSARKARSRTNSRSTCPACGSHAVREEGESGAPLHRRADLPGAAVERLRHFVSRDAFDIEGLGEKQVQAFFAEGLIK